MATAAGFAHPRCPPSAEAACGRSLATRWRSLVAGALIGLLASVSQAEEAQPHPGDDSPSVLHSYEIDWLSAVLHESIEACRSVQQAADLPIRCALYYVKSRQTLSITFPDNGSMQDHILTIAERIVFPFCQTTYQYRQPYLMFFIITQSNIGNLYSCAKDSFSGWFDLSALDHIPPEAPPRP